jgi:hypothetical protein
MSFEDDLRRSLRRTAAPADLTDRVLARVEQHDTVSVNARPSGRLRALPWLAAAATISLMTARGAQYYGDRERFAEAERVKADIRVALQITSETLTFVQHRVQDSYK